MAEAAVASALIALDGSAGEGGGQIIRTALALCLLTGRPLHIRNVRGRRTNPGLQPQHVACVKAAITVGNISEGAVLQQHEFSLPGASHTTPLATKYEFDVGGSGSAALVIQSILPVLLLRCRPDVDTIVTVKGGTHTGLCPTIDFLVNTFTPVLRRIGFHCAIKLNRVGIAPIGGGVVTVTVRGCQKPGLVPLRFMRSVRPDGGVMTRTLVLQHTEDRADAKTAGSQPANIPADFVAQLASASGVPDVTLEQLPCRGSAIVFADRYHIAPAPCMVEADAKTVAAAAAEEGSAWTMVLSSVMAPVKNRDASEKLPQAAAEVLKEMHVQAAAWCQARGLVAADEYLCDQLLLPLAIGVGGVYTATSLSLNTFTDAWLINHVLGEGTVSFHQLTALDETTSAAAVAGEAILLPTDAYALEEAAAAYCGGPAIVTVVGRQLK